MPLARAEGEGEVLVGPNVLLKLLQLPLNDRSSNDMKKKRDGERENMIFFLGVGFHRWEKLFPRVRIVI